MCTRNGAKYCRSSIKKNLINYDAKGGGQARLGLRTQDAMAHRELNMKREEEDEEEGKKQRIYISANDDDNQAKCKKCRGSCQNIRNETKCQIAARPRLLTN